MITKVQNLVPILKLTKTFGVFYDQESQEVFIEVYPQDYITSKLVGREKIQFPISKIFQLDRRVRKVIEKFYRRKK